MCCPVFMCCCSAKWMASQFCGFILIVLNTAIAAGYYFGVFTMEMGCDDNCYDGLTLLVAVIVAPALLYIFGYFLAWMACVRGKKKHKGCGFCCTSFWAISLLLLLIVMCYHAFQMIKYKEYEISEYYAGPVLGNILYAAFLCCFLCNVMPKDDKPDDRRSGSYSGVPQESSADSDMERGPSYAAAI